jgi:hypothetical protein
VPAALTRGCRLSGCGDHPGAGTLRESASPLQASAGRCSPGRTFLTRAAAQQAINGWIQYR